MTLDPDILDYKFCNDRLPQKKIIFVKGHKASALKKKQLFQNLPGGPKIYQTTPKF